MEVHVRTWLTAIHVRVQQAGLELTAVLILTSALVIHVSMGYAAMLTTSTSAPATPDGLVSTVIQVRVGIVFSRLVIQPLLCVSIHVLRHYDTLRMN